MTEEIQKIEGTFVDGEILETINDIINACGNIPLKQKVSMLFLSIDYIFENNKELMPAFSDRVTIH